LSRPIRLAPQIWFGVPYDAHANERTVQFHLSRRLPPSRATYCTVLTYGQQHRNPRGHVKAHAAGVGLQPSAVTGGGNGGKVPVVT
jgi:hypothetical protein